MRFNFGKHKGEEITDVEIRYLKWLEEQDWISTELRNELNHEINRREGDRPGAGLVKMPEKKFTIKGVNDVKGK